jgi:hypothetical protein
MTCPRCNCPDSRVSYTRSKVRPDRIYRRRRCLNLRCRATFRTWEQLDPRDPCRGRRPGEPRRVLGRPGSGRSGPGKPPEPVEITSATDSTTAPYPPEDWREQFAAAVKRALPELVGPEG